MGISLELRRFSTVGIVAAFAHIIIALAMIICLEAGALLSNLVGFLVAVNISFYGHYHWSFQSKTLKINAFIKFFATASIAFMLNNMLLLFLLRLGILNEIAAVLIANFIIPVVTFLISRIWVFR